MCARHANGKSAQYCINYAWDALGCHLYFPIALPRYGQNYIKVNQEGLLFLSALIFPQICSVPTPFAIRLVYPEHCEDSSVKKDAHACPLEGICKRIVRIVFNNHDQSYLNIWAMLNL